MENNPWKLWFKCCGLYGLWVIRAMGCFPRGLYSGTSLLYKKIDAPTLQRIQSWARNFVEKFSELFSSWIWSSMSQILKNHIKSLYKFQIMYESYSMIFQLLQANSKNDN